MKETTDLPTLKGNTVKTYIGTKIITAQPMTRAEYNTYRNWELPANEDGNDEGYLVEYTDGGKGNDSRHAGYISWSPKAQFEGAYRETSGLTFGLALEMLKKGAKVARAGWNGVKPLLTRFVPVDRAPVIFDGMTHIKLDDGSVAICEASVFPLVDGKVWWKTAGGYAAFTNENVDGTRSTVTLHQLLNPSWEMTDHDNGDKLDNRALNLRPCTAQQNNFNREAKSGSSAFKGVSWDGSRDKWIVSIMHNGKTLHIGRFEDEHEAAKAYDQRAAQLFGEFAKLNFPMPRMWLSLSGPLEGRTISHDKFWSPHNAQFAYDQPNSEATVLPCITMKTATGEILMGWLASQTDMLAEDWVVVA